MTEKSYKSRWRSVMASGLFFIAVGAFLIVYAIIVVERSRFPADSVLYLINGFSLIGWGIGYLVCARIIRDLERKIGKLEEELHAQTTKTA